MKLRNRILCLLLVLAMTAICFAGCNGSDETTETTDADIHKPETQTESDIPGSDVVEEGDLRVIITSDVHHCDTQWYGISSSVRMQWWVNAIKAEHEAKPVDLIIIAGDTSLDYYGDKGSYTHGGVSWTKDWMNKYVSRLPEGVPVFVMPGNHEAYTNADWKRITGQDRQQAYAIKGNLFVMLDTFAEEVGSKYDGDAAYTPVDVKFVEDQMAAHPECSKVWLVAHYFDTKSETDEFKALLKNNSKIKGLFAGHLHKNTVINLGSEFGNKKIAQLGNFSYSYATAYPTGKEEDDLSNLKNTFWGFRELIITSEAAISNYIICKTKDNKPANAVPNWAGNDIKLDRRSVESIRFY